MDRTAKAGIMIIATGMVIAGLYYFRAAIVQFALALLVYVGVEALTSWLDRRVRFMPRWLALGLALVFVIAVIGWIGWFMAENIGEFTARSDQYGARIDAVITQAYGTLGLDGAPPTVKGLLRDVDGARVLGAIASGLQDVTANAVFILVYLGFILAAARGFPKKLDAIFPGPEARAHVAQIFNALRLSVQKYLWVTTYLGALTSVVLYVALLLIGLDNPLFWAILIFFLSFIPTIGPFIGTVLPVLYALVQFDGLAPVGAVAAAVGGAHFVAGNFVQPRLTGNSLNLSALVILLALALWGVLWGIAGAFLATPLTVMGMTLLAQFSSTRWIAILLSADGNPPTFARAAATKAGS